MLRDDTYTVGIIAALSRGPRRIASLGRDDRMHPHRPGAFPTVDELHSVTLLSWQSFHNGDILTPIAVDPPAHDVCLAHFLEQFAREARSEKSGQEMPCRHRRETGQ